ncbi:hypothetical protein AKJ57_05370 [candidate division MSBL1 archaeon SCGC-AAA259A05]|uniref:Uncharacterized protein n=1 Tax=candidate division MSBL1 archaeon SCGC-AAA259A05 TaxID=1698259 RepID=A0A133U5G3_9EURY|nr:hypothetical protein AKJ57_05370 [candidate division MSBL1 archaeon SCGC-AAA259A05]
MLTRNQTLSPRVELRIFSGELSYFLQLLLGDVSHHRKLVKLSLISLDHADEPNYQPDEPDDEPYGWDEPRH